MSNRPYGAKARVYIYDMDGREMMYREVTAEESTLDLDIQIIPAGLYIVRLMNKEGDLCNRRVSIIK